MDYSVKKISDNLFHVLSHDGKVITNHNDIPFPPLSEKMSSLLCEDLNDILLSEQSSQQEKLSPAPLNLRRSFTYCFLSTITQSGGHDFELDIPYSIQWDRLFRLNPGPPLLVTELIRNEKAIAFFGSDYVRLPLNFSESIEEMLVNDVAFVPEAIIKKVKNITVTMLPAERFVVDLLFEFFERVSISLPVLWVAGIITDEDFMGGMWIFINSEDIYDLEGENKDNIQFLIDRLRFLRSAMDLYKTEGITTEN